MRKGSVWRGAFYPIHDCHSYWTAGNRRHIGLFDGEYYNADHNLHHCNDDDRADDEEMVF